MGSISILAAQESLFLLGLSGCYLCESCKWLAPIQEYFWQGTQPLLAIQLGLQGVLGLHPGFIRTVKYNMQAVLDYVIVIMFAPRAIWSGPFWLKKKFPRPKYVKIWNLLVIAAQGSKQLIKLNEKDILKTFSSYHFCWIIRKFVLMTCQLNWCYWKKKVGSFQCH